MTVLDRSRIRALACFVFSAILLLDVCSESLGLPSLMAVSHIQATGTLEVFAAIAILVYGHNDLKRRNATLGFRSLVFCGLVVVLFALGIAFVCLGAKRDRYWDAQVTDLVNGKQNTGIKKVTWQDKPAASNVVCNFIGKKREGLFERTALYEFRCQDGRVLKVRLDVDPIHNEGRASVTSDR